MGNSTRRSLFWLVSALVQGVVLAIVLVFAGALFLLLEDIFERRSGGVVGLFVVLVTGDVSHAAAYSHLFPIFNLWMFRRIEYFKL